jgi:ABC-2 type transport system permease protein
VNEIRVLVGKEFLEQLRKKKILIIGIVFLFVAIASPIIAKLTPEILKSLVAPGMSFKLPEPTYKDAVSQFIKNISQIVILVLVFVVAGSISDEKLKRTLEIILTKPISRAKYILSKFISYFLSIAVIFVASSILFYFYTVTTFEKFSFANFSIMATVVLLYILMVVGITIFASTIVNSSILAGGIGFVSYIIIGTLFSLIGRIAKYSPNRIFSNYQDIISHGWNSGFFIPLMIIFLIILISIISSVTTFQKLEIER